MKFYHALLILCMPVALFGADSDGDGIRQSNGINTEGLIAYYPFSGNAFDFSANNNNGYVEGARLVSDRFGNPDSAYSFDGVDDRIVVPSPLGGWPSDSEERTITVWINKPEIRNQSESLFAFGDGLGSNTRVSLYFRNNDFAFIGNYNDFTIEGFPEIGIWQHISMVYDSKTISIFINGLKVSSFSKNLETNGSFELIIGSNSLNRNDEFFFGIIDDFRLYERALTDAEVGQLYNQEKFPPTPGLPSGSSLGMLQEPKIGDTLTLDATATSGYPAPTYQWYYEGFPISSVVGGNQPVLSIPVTLNPSVEGVYRCVVSNSEGTVEVETRVVLFRDDDNDGLSNYQETNIHLTDPQDSDSDDDGLSDGVEINDHLTNPNDADSDDDGFSDYDEVTVYQSDPLVLNVAWGRYIVGTDNWINTRNWLGWLKVEEGGWLWSVNEKSYIWVPESSAEAGSGWVYHP